MRSSSGVSDKPLDYLKRIDDNLVVLRCYCLGGFVDNDVRGYCMEIEALDLCGGRLWSSNIDFVGGGARFSDGDNVRVPTLK